VDRRPCAGAGPSSTSAQVRQDQNPVILSNSMDALTPSTRQAPSHESGSQKSVPCLSQVIDHQCVSTCIPPDGSSPCYVHRSHRTAGQLYATDLEGVFDLRACQVPSASRGQQEAFPGEFPFCMRVGLHDRAPLFFVPTGENALITRPACPCTWTPCGFFSGQLGSGGPPNWVIFLGSSSSKSHEKY
jgi:hypothetical protein